MHDLPNPHLTARSFQAAAPARTRRWPRAAGALGLAGSVLLSACGGGSDDAAGATAEADDSVVAQAQAATGSASATALAANAVLLASDASGAVDNAVQTARTMVRATAGGTATVPHDCAGGGSVTLTVSGVSAASVLNGRLDAGEVYRFTFDQCRGRAGAVAIDGALAMTVTSVSSASLSLDLEADALTVTGPRGSAALAGRASYTRSTADGANGSVVTTGHTTADTLTLTTHRNGNTSSFTLGAVDVTRTVTTLNGVRQSTTISGSHGVDATVRGVRHQYTVATAGGVTAFGAGGAPTAGHWKLTTSKAYVDVTLQSPNVTILVDEGQDGTIDRSRTLTIRRLLRSAG